MKKVYQTPVMEIENVQTEQMLAASAIGFGGSIENAGLAEGGEFDDIITDEEW